ncbi:hypothetical protein [Salinisphaera sp. T31B1]|uniref:hypothetical protein n=1 Tax=Salinisphaera sp. T31B1 TaxID=727963 RepID=UPI00333FE17A
MKGRCTRGAQAAALCLSFLAGGCVISQPEPRSVGPLDEPIDAFEAVGAPDRSGGAPQSDRDLLSTDIQRLQNARETYENEQRRLSAERQREQAECRQRPDSRQVQIQDGTGDPAATYCQPADEDR